MPDTESLRRGLLSWIQSLDESGLFALHKVRRNMDPNIGHSAAPAGWIPIEQIAADTGHHVGHLARRCREFWQPLGQASKYRHHGRITWHITQPAACKFCVENPAPTASPQAPANPQQIVGMIEVGHNAPSVESNG